jgi:hypothetical protein
MRTPTVGGEEMPGEPGSRSPPCPTSGLGEQSQRVPPHTKGQLLSPSVRHPSPASTSFVLGLSGLRALHVDPDSLMARAANQEPPTHEQAPASGRTGLAYGEAVLDNNRSFRDAVPGQVIFGREVGARRRELLLGRFVEALVEVTVDVDVDVLGDADG